MNYLLKSEPDKYSYDDLLRDGGVGRLKRAWLGDYLGPDALALNQRIKDALDPDGILNPGAVF